jgi:hypothetical protein
MIEKIAARLGARFHRILFTALLGIFVGTLIVSATGLRERPALMPLAVGIPTMLAILVQLWWDFRGKEEPEPDLVVPASTAMFVSEEVEKILEEEVEEDPRRIVFFSLWIIAFVLVAWFVSFRVAVPIGLFAILYFATRGWKISLFSTIGVSAVLWLLYEYFLEVRF